MKKARLFNRNDRDRSPSLVHEAYISSHLDGFTTDLIIYSRNERLWRIIGDFKGCPISSLIGSRLTFQIESWIIPHGISYIYNHELKFMFKVHVTD